MIDLSVMILSHGELKCFQRRQEVCVFTQTCVVQTPQGHEYDGRSCNGKGVSNVPVL